MKLPAYEIPEQDKDLWDCGRVISTGPAFPPCGFCGKPFKSRRPNAYVYENADRYCSPDCKDMAARKRQSARRRRIRNET